MGELDQLVAAARAIPGIESAAVFAQQAEGAGLQLASAAGIQGPALDGLVAAVKDPSHPIAQALGAAAASFNVSPVNRGGPALRSHLPLAGLGVLAVSHASPLTAEAQAELERLAASAKDILGRSA